MKKHAELLLDLIHLVRGMLGVGSGAVLGSAVAPRIAESLERVAVLIVGFKGMNMRVWPGC